MASSIMWDLSDENISLIFRLTNKKLDAMALKKLIKNDHLKCRKSHHVDILQSQNIADFGWVTVCSARMYAIDLFSFSLTKCHKAVLFMDYLDIIKDEYVLGQGMCHIRPLILCLFFSV